MKLIESVKEVDIYDQNDNLIDIKDYVKEPVIVVGNSPSLLNSNLGVDIDRFNTVMRINNYRSGGGGGEYDKDVGKKTDMWVSGASKNSEIKKQNVNTILTLIVFPKYWYWRVIYRYRRIKYRMHKFLNLEDIPNQLCFYDVRFCQKMYRHYNNDKFTTGTLLIMLLIISGISDITITGVNLDYLDYGINDRYYYKVDKLSAKQKRKMKIFTFIKKVINSKYVVYCPRHVHSYVDYKLKRIGFNHDFTKERKVLEQIVKQYKIKKL